MKSSAGSRGSSRSVTNILNGATSQGTLDGGTPRSGSVLSGSGPLTGTASLHNSKLSINSQGSQQSQNSQKPIQEIAADAEPTFLEKAKFYSSLCLGTTAILSVFAFLFLIPFVVDPAISTIVADFDHVPVTCIVVEHTYAEGLRNCTWSSCREGCTTAAVKCHQLLVNYTKIPFEEFKNTERQLSSVTWDVGETRLLINFEGCGYPPRVNCTDFARDFGYQHIGEPFPCYYSRAYPENVITRYSWDDNLRHLILSLIIPNVLFAFSIGVLSYFYCPCCDKACHKSTRVYAEKFPSKEDKLLCPSDDDDDDELDY